MSGPEMPNLEPDQFEGNKTIAFTFTFARQWQVSPVNDVGANDTHIMPPGGGLTPTKIGIGPAQFAGKSASEIAKIVHERTKAMALVSEAVALATIEFSDALGQAISGADEFRRANPDAPGRT